MSGPSIESAHRDAEARAIAPFTLTGWMKMRFDWLSVNGKPPFGLTAAITMPCNWPSVNGTPPFGLIAAITMPCNWLSVNGDPPFRLSEAQRSRSPIRIMAGPLRGVEGPCASSRSWVLLAAVMRLALCTLLLLAAACGEDSSVRVRPQLIPPDATLAFGEVPVLNEKQIPVPLTNVGRGALRILAVTFRETGLPFRIGEYPSEIRSGGDAEVPLTFVPPAEAPYAGTLLIETDDPGTPLLEIAVTGAGQTAAVMEVEPLALDFGRVNEGGAAVQSFSVLSKGNADLILQSLTFAPGSAPGFSFVGGAKTPAIVSKPDAGEPGAIELSVKYAVVEGAPDTATGAVHLVGTDPAYREAVIQLTGAVNRAPRAIIAPIESAAPGSTVTLDGRGSFDPDNDGPLTYQWKLLRQPAGVQATLATPTADTTTLTLDAVQLGTYEVELTVTDALGAKNLHASRLTLVATPPQKLRVEMFWTNAPADVDLHVLRSPDAALGAIPDDCHYANKAPDWGALQDASDDPRLFADAKTGFGPEVFGYENPVAGTYRIAVKYQHEQLSIGPETPVTVRVYWFGVLHGEFTRTLTVRGEVWNVADIAWPSGTLTVLETP